MKNLITASRLSGKIRIPSSKSDSQRSLLAAALANGVSVISNVGQSDDEQNMLKCIQSLGAQVQVNQDNISIQGITHFPKQLDLNCGESGLGLRLLTSICAAHEGTHRITGEGSVLTRDHSFFEEHFPAMGVGVTSNGGKLPMEISGQLKSGKYTVDGSQSSQYISGLLMAFPLLDGDSELTIEDLKSKPYVEMTIETLKAFGIKIQEQGHCYLIHGNQTYQPTNYIIESDWSSASYWLVAAALGHELELTGLNLESKQADLAMLHALKKANCHIHSSKDSISIDGTQRKAFVFDATDCPDLFPALVALAAGCDGVSKISGVYRLKNKESDRGVVLQKEYALLGLKLEIQGDEMIIFGGSKLHGGTVDSNNDHRIAMCLGITATFINDEVELLNADAVSKSYPMFWNDLDQLN